MSYIAVYTGKSYCKFSNKFLNKELSNDTRILDLFYSGCTVRLQKVFFLSDNF